MRELNRDLLLRIATQLEELSDELGFLKLSDEPLYPSVLIKKKLRYRGPFVGIQHVIEDVTNAWVPRAEHFNAEVMAVFRTIDAFEQDLASQYWDGFTAERDNAVEPAEIAKTAELVSMLAQALVRQI